MQREIDKELMEIKKEIGTLRDKVVSAKAMMEQAEKQVLIYVDNISQMISEDKKEEFNTKAKALSDNLSSETAATELFEWINSYVEDVNIKNAETIDRLKEEIENWKQITA